MFLLIVTPMFTLLLAWMYAKVDWIRLSDTRRNCICQLKMNDCWIFICRRLKVIQSYDYCYDSRQLLHCFWGVAENNFKKQLQKVNQPKRTNSNNETTLVYTSATQSQAIVEGWSSLLLENTNSWGECTQHRCDGFLCRHIKSSSGESGGRFGNIWIGNYCWDIM